MPHAERSPGLLSPPQEAGHTPMSETAREGAVSEQEVIDLLAALPIPITITRKIRKRDGRPHYTYQIGERTEEQPYGLGMGATPSFLDAVRFSLQRAMQPKKGGS